MEFAKLHGLGNDFLVVNIDQKGRDRVTLASLARKICHRRCGIGADGILYYNTATGDLEADLEARIFNADGSEAEISGNGIRCLAAFLHRCSRFAQPTVRIRTISGVRRVTLQEQNGNVYTYESAMGEPVTDPVRIGVNLGSGSKTIVGFPLKVGSAVIPVTVCSLGNPHCSTFWPQLERAPVESLGPALEKHEAFPNRTNVEFIQVLDRQRLRVRFWERGAGYTMASGTGSCAAVVAATLHDYVRSPVTVETDMGMLRVNWAQDGHLFLIGPAEFICSGTYDE